MSAKTATSILETATSTTIPSKQKIGNMHAISSVPQRTKTRQVISFLCHFRIKQRAVVMNDGKTYPKSSTHSPPCNASSTIGRRVHLSFRGCTLYTTSRNQEQGCAEYSSYSSVFLSSSNRKLIPVIMLLFMSFILELSSWCEKCDLATYNLA